MLRFTTANRKPFTSKIPFTLYIIVFFTVINTLFFLSKESTDNPVFWLLFVLNFYVFYWGYNVAKKRWIFFQEIVFDGLNFKLIQCSHSDINIKRIFEGNIQELYFVIEPIQHRITEPFQLIIMYRGEKYYLFQDNSYWTEDKLWQIVQYIYNINPDLVKMNVAKKYIQQYIEKS
ncbi:MAG: hypothetical protein N4A35_11290 [Flavobacteriales bacterium]|jgi:hypothetical protein|nr:hypothetical protein [Flavobacteriales bacterium]